MATTTLPEPVLIATFWKNRAHDAVRVTLKTYEGHNLVDVRQFKPVEGGTHQPTTKGVAMSVQRLPELADAINKALAKARELGLIGAASEAIT